MDLQPPQMTRTGSMKRMFDIVDASGLYINCCATKHNISNVVLQNHREVILYYCLGRWTSAKSQGMLFLMHDAMIVPLGEPSTLQPAKLEQLSWYLAKRNDTKERTREPKRVHITREHVRRMGPTDGCRGCRAAKQGLPAENHSEACRKHLEGCTRAGGDPLLARADLRLRTN